MIRNATLLLGGGKRVDQEVRPSQLVISNVRLITETSAESEYCVCEHSELGASNVSLKGADAMPRIKSVLCISILIAFAGCNRMSKEATEQPPAPAPQPSVQQPAEQPPAQENAPQVAQPEAPAPIAAPAKIKPTVAKPKQTPKKEAAAHSEPQPPLTRQPAAQPTETAPAAPQPSASTTLAPSQPTIAAPPLNVPQVLTIPGGTSMQVRLQDPLDSAVNKPGDTFRALLDRDIEIGGKTIAPRGSLVEGKLSQVARAGRVEGLASMALQLTSLKIGEQSYQIQTEILTFQADSTKKQDATKVGVGAGLGAVIGAIAGGGKGAAIGAAVGAGAAGVTVAATRGKEIQFAAEHKLSFALAHDVNIKLQ